MVTGELIATATSVMLDYQQYDYTSCGYGAAPHSYPGAMAPPPTPELPSPAPHPAEYYYDHYYQGPPDTEMMADSYSAAYYEGNYPAYWWQWYLS